MKSFDHRKYRPAPSVAITNRQWPSRRIEKAPIWSSVDLRDGNQALVEPMSVTQKRLMWAQLLKLGFKQIEIGFPAASQADYDFARWLIEEDQIPEDVQVQVLVQAREALIVKTFEALKGVKQAIVHVYNSTSTVQREQVFAMDRKGVTNIAVQGAQWVKREATKHPDSDWQFQYSPESFTTTEMDYAVEICEAVIDVWQPTPQQKCIINLPATVESGTPNIFADQVEYFCTHISRRDSIIVSLHTHNDRGCAVAAAELGLMAGADRVEGTLMGNGERTGNMDVITMAMNLYSQGINPELDLSNPDEMVRVVTECTQIPANPRHPWVGELVYTAFSGSHQDAIRKCLKQQQADAQWQVAYLPIDPQDLGRDYQAVIRVNSQSGKGGVAFVLERDYGLSLPRWMQAELAQLVQKVSEAGGGVVDGETIYQLFTEHFVKDSVPVALSGYQLENNGTCDTLELRIMADGVERLVTGAGEGVISAFVDAWQLYSGQLLSVIDYSEHAIEEGADAEAIAYVQLEIAEQRFAGAAFDHDTVSASLKALISALNRASLEKNSLCDIPVCTTTGKRAV
ncbi:MAG: 2-isopropylmalate synthase [Gammaproteobacteria bacterium]|nr:2-isopropylmalate synthase [Gammaproteobacteria bacterium]